MKTKPKHVTDMHNKIVSIDGIEFEVAYDGSLYSNDKKHHSYVGFVSGTTKHRFRLSVSYFGFEFSKTIKYSDVKILRPVENEQ